MARFKYLKLYKDRPALGWSPIDLKQIKKELSRYYIDEMVVLDSLKNDLEFVKTPFALYKVER